MKARITLPEAIAIAGAGSRLLGQILAAAADAQITAREARAIYRAADRLAQSIKDALRIEPAAGTVEL